MGGGGSGAAFMGNSRPIYFEEGVADGIGERLQFRRRWARLLFRRRHFAARHAIVNAHPRGEILRVGRLEFQRRKIKSAFFRVTVVAFETVLVNEGINVGGRGCKSRKRRNRNHQNAFRQQNTECPYF